MTTGPKKRKVTLLLDEEVARDLSGAVERGVARSQGALVQEAVTTFLTSKRREELRAAYSEAARDPKFLQDINDVMADFEMADSEVDRDS